MLFVLTMTLTALLYGPHLVRYLVASYRLSRLNYRS